MNLALSAKKQISWIADGEKYALIGLEVKFEYDLPLTQLTPNHWVMVDPRFDVLDGENQLLMNRASNFYTGLLLSSTFAPAHRPVMLTGSCQDGEIGIRSQSDFDTPIPHALRYYPPILKEEIERAARLAVALEAGSSNTSRSHWRFFRTLSLYTEARSIRTTSNGCINTAAAQRGSSCLTPAIRSVSSAAAPSCSSARAIMS